MNSKLVRTAEEVENPNKENEGPTEPHPVSFTAPSFRRPLQDITDLLYPKKKKHPHST